MKHGARFREARGAGDRRNERGRPMRWFFIIAGLSGVAFAAALQIWIDHRTWHNSRRYATLDLRKWRDDNERGDRK